MIAFLKGIIREVNLDNIALEVNGIGYKIFMTKREMYNFNISDEVLVYTELIVKEDDLSLFGFSDNLEREIFNHLRSVSGVGSKSAISILDKFSAKEVIYLINKEDFNSFTSVSGIGKKTSQKIIIELLDKFKKLNVLSDAQTIEKTNSISQEKEDAILALESLGYSRSQINTVISKLDNELSSQEIIKAALVMLSRSI